MAIDVQSMLYVLVSYAKRTHIVVHCTNKLATPWSDGLSAAMHGYLLWKGIQASTCIFVNGLVTTFTCSHTALCNIATAFKFVVQAMHLYLFPAYDWHTRWVFFCLSILSLKSAFYVFHIRTCLCLCFLWMLPDINHHHCPIDRFMANGTRYYVVNTI